jgi:hypothetical protein
VLTAPRRYLLGSRDDTTSTQKLLECILRIYSQCVTEFDELDDVHSPFTSLDLGNERLGVAQLPAQLSLRQTNLATKISKQA